MVKSSTNDRLSRTFTALSHPVRRALLHQLRLGDQSVVKLAAPHDISLPAISKHLGVLERAGLVTRLRVGSTHLIQLRVAALRHADQWLTSFDDETTAAKLEKLESLLK